MYITPTVSLPIPSAQVLAADVGAHVAPLTVPVLRVVALGERALGVGGESSSTENILSNAMPTMEVTNMMTSTSATPFFTTASEPPNVQTTSSSGGSGLTKTVLEWVFAIAALIIIAALSVWRYAKLRRTRQPLQAFIPHIGGRSTSPSRPQNVPRTTGLPRVSTSGEPQAADMSDNPLFYPPSLASGRYASVMEPLPAVIASATGATPGAASGTGAAGTTSVSEERRGRRAARAHDIDAHGRRINPRDVDDANGDDKDELPAYDNLGGPPKYADLEMQAQQSQGGRSGGGIQFGETLNPLRWLRVRFPSTSTSTEESSGGRQSQSQSQSPISSTGSSTPQNGQSSQASQVTQDAQTTQIERPASAPLPQNNTIEVPHELPPPFSSSPPSRSSTPVNASRHVPQI